MTKLDNLIKARQDLEESLRTREAIIETYTEPEPYDLKRAEELRGQIHSLRWAERLARAAIVIHEERTPEGVSETLIDELCKVVP